MKGSEPSPIMLACLTYTAIWKLTRQNPDHDSEELDNYITPGAIPGLLTRDHDIHTVTFREVHNIIQPIS